MSARMAGALVENKLGDKLSKDGQDELVVECAAELFLRDGLGSVKMVDIAKSAGMGVATLYRHFSTKARIAVRAAILLWKRFNQRLVEIVESDSFLALDGLGRLQVLLEGYCDAYCAYGDFVTFVDSFDHMVLAGQVSQEELAEYGAQLDSFYPIFEDAYLLGRLDGSIVREIEFRKFYVALAHSLMGVAQKINHGEVIPSDDFSNGREELQSVVDMALWSLVTNVPVPRVRVDL
ncbi:MAG: TetR/AcrR family transcriptional regulator [Atopobiaceae bacterium]|nr:TetR/AcrR family transcriptional regulator [Atopobiaceae bacterium]